MARKRSGVEADTRETPGGKLDRREFLRLAGVGAGVMAFPGFLAACGGDSGGSTGGVGWASWNPSEEEAKELLGMFRKSHPDIEVSYDNQEYGDYIQALKLDFASGRAADVVGLQAGSMLAEYNEFLDDLTPRLEEDLGSGWQSSFYDVDLEQLRGDGKLSAIPVYSSAAGYVWYNKTLFDRNDLQPPETLDEWVRVSRTLESKGVTPFVQGAKEAWVNLDMYIALANQIVPARIYDAEAGEEAWTDPGLVEAMTLWGEMFQNGIMQRGALGVLQYPDAHDTWTRGEAGMILMGMWNNDHMLKSSMENFKTTLDFEEDWEFLPIRLPDVNGDGEGSRLFGGPDVALALNARSDDKDAAWQLMNFLLSDKAQEFFAQTLRTPSVKGVSFDYSGLLYPETQRPVLEQEIEDFENAIGRRELRYPEIKTALSDALQEVATGEVSPEQAMRSVEKASRGVER